MARFDVYKISPNEYALDCQADMLSGLPTRFTVPLVAEPAATRGAARLNPRFTVEGRTVVMLTEFSGAVPRTGLKDKVGTLADEDYTIQLALDFLLTGI